MMISKGLVIVSAILVITSSLFAQDKVDENEMFSDTSSIIDSSKMVNTKAATEAAGEKNSLGFSGEMNVYGTPSMSRAWFDHATASSISFSPYLVGNGLVDARLKGGAKVFADLETDISPQITDSVSSSMLPGIKIPVTSGGTVFDARELFLDANIGHAVYFRAGKQVLQWGTCTLWNPTDLVNVERKTFIAKMGHREGTYGLKVHIPYKTLFNFYSFIDANNVTKVNGLAAAVKAEVLLDRTEMSLSAWKRDSVKPVFGFDFSSRLWDVLIAGEAALRNGKSIASLDLSGPLPRLSTLNNSWLPRVALNLTKLLPLAGVPDRLTISAEGYYNQAGFDTNIFNDPRVRNLSSIMNFTSSNGTPLLSIYEPNSYSKYYASIFCSISQFFMDELSFSCNALGNFNQKSFVLVTGITYANLDNFNAGISVIGAVGPEHTEYTTLYDALSIRLQMGVTF